RLMGQLFFPQRGARLQENGCSQQSCNKEKEQEGKATLLLRQMLIQERLHPLPSLLRVGIFVFLPGSIPEFIIPILRPHFFVQLDFGETKFFATVFSLWPNSIWMCRY